MYINCILMQGFCLDMLLLTVNVMYGASRCCLILRSEVSLPLLILGDSHLKGTYFGIT